MACKHRSLTINTAPAAAAAYPGAAFIDHSDNDYCYFINDDNDDDAIMHDSGDNDSSGGGSI